MLNWIRTASAASALPWPATLAVTALPRPLRRSGCGTRRAPDRRRAARATRSTGAPRRGRTAARANATEYLRERCGQARRHRQHQVGLGDDVWGREKMRNRDCDLPFVAVSRERIVHRPAGLAARGDQHVLRRRKARDGEPPAGQRVPLAHHAHKSLVEQTHLLQARPFGLESDHSDHQVGLRALELAERIIPERTQPDLELRCLARQRSDQARQQQELDVVRCRDSEAPRGDCRIEARRREQAFFEQLETLGQRFGDRKRSRGRHHPVRRAHYQRIPERRAQPRKRVAGGRLAQPEPLRGPRNTALFEQSVQHQCQIQVQARHMRNMHVEV